MLSFVFDDHVTGYTANFSEKTCNTIIYLYIANWNNLNILLYRLSGSESLQVILDMMFDDHETGYSRHFMAGK